MPHKQAHTKQRGKEAVNRQINEAIPAASTMRLPKVASLYFEKFYENLFIKTALKTWLTPKAMKTSPSEKLTLWL